MSHTTADDLRQWVHERFAEGDLAAIAVVHYTASHETEIHNASAKLPADKWNAEAVATTIAAICERHARGLPGVQQFQCLAMHGASAKPTSVLPLQRVGALTTAPSPGGGLLSEPPTPTGLTATAQRWGELVLQHAQAKDLALTGVLGNLVKDLGNTTTDLLSRYMEAALGLQKLAADQQAARAKAAVDVIHARRNAALADTAMRLAPSAINAIAGSPVFPQATASVGVLRGLARTLTREQVEHLLSLGGGGPENQMALAALLHELDAIRTQDESDASKLRELEQQEFPGIDPELDAAGLVEPNAEPLAKAMAQPILVEAKQLAGSNGTSGAHANGTNGAAPKNGNGHTPAPSEGDEMLDELLDAAGGSLPLLLHSLEGKRPKLAERLRTRLAKQGKG